MSTVTHTQYGSRTRLFVNGSVSSYASGTRLAIETTGVTSMVSVVRVKIVRTAGTAANFTPRIYSTAAGGIGTVSQQFFGSNTLVADVFDVACTSVVFDTDATGKLYLEFGPNVGADNAFDYELIIEVL